MAVSVVMPALEMAQETGKLVSWLKKEGEHVSKGDMLLEIETDKAVMEIEALGDGILAGVTAQPGDVIPVGQTIAWLVAPGEQPPAAAAPLQTGRKMEAPVAAPAAASTTAASTAGTDTAGAPRLSPRARRLAKEHGIDPATIAGSGPSGEIQAEDILRAAEARGASAATAPPPAARGTAPGTIGRIMAERTTASWTTVPHFFVSRELDVTALNAARARLLPLVDASHGVRLTHTDLLVALVARALAAHPRLNASWVDGTIATHEPVNMALAMAVEGAVVTAVIPDAGSAPLGAIAARRKELAERARSHRLQPADITGGTFTISNLGMFDVDAFTAIIVPPQAAILAVGAIVERPVVVDGAIVARPMMNVTLSADHRVVDGAGAAAFLKDLATLIQTADAQLSAATTGANR